jgi:hypothetical protein
MLEWSDKMKKTILFGLGFLLVVGLVSMIGVLAYKGDPNVQGPNYDADVHEQLEAAIESGDYDAWIQIREDNNLPMKGRMFQVINADNFYKFSELHNAMQSGDYETANAIKAELGLGQGMMKRGNSEVSGKGASQGRVSGQGACGGTCGQSADFANGVHTCPMQN